VPGFFTSCKRKERPLSVVSCPLLSQSKQLIGFTVAGQKCRAGKAQPRKGGQYIPSLFDHGRLTTDNGGSE
jgi:hypothetical protein